MKLLQYVESQSTGGTKAGIDSAENVEEVEKLATVDVVAVTADLLTTGPIHTMKTKHQAINNGTDQFNEDMMTRHQNIRIVVHNHLHRRQIFKVKQTLNQD